MHMNMLSHFRHMIRSNASRPPIAQKTSRRPQYRSRLHMQQYYKQHVNDLVKLNTTTLGIIAGRLGEGSRLRSQEVVGDHDPVWSCLMGYHLGSGPDSSLA